jgi:chromosome segregation ATPase
MNILKNALLSSVLTMGVVLGAGAEQFDGRAPGGTEVAISASEQEYLKATAAYNDKQILITTLLTELLKYAKPKENDLVQNGPLTDVAFEVDDYFRRLVDDFNSLKLQLVDERSAKQKLEKEKADVEKELETLKTAKKSTDEELIAKTIELDTEKKRVKDLDDLLKTTQADAVINNKNKEARIKVLENEMTAANAKVEALEADVTRLTIECKTIQTKLDEDSRRKTSEVVAKTKELEADNDRIRARLARNAAQNNAAQNSKNGK